MIHHKKDDHAENEYTEGFCGENAIFNRSIINFNYFFFVLTPFNTDINHRECQASNE